MFNRMRLDCSDSVICTEGTGGAAAFGSGSAAVGSAATGVSGDSGPGTSGAFCLRAMDAGHTDVQLRLEDAVDCVAIQDDDRTMA